MTRRLNNTDSSIVGRVRLDLNQGALPGAFFFLATAYRVDATSRWSNAQAQLKMYKILYQIEANMAISARDIVPLSQARASLSELAEQVKAGAEKIITKNGESYIALIDAERLDYYHQLERERIHLLLINEASRGLEDVAAGRTQDARTTLEELKRRRSE